ncbi:MAG: formylglycine-generating enzyme family protein [Alphaproteobacteria bacterium]|nr:formylglycine-generating enzyme family protein [Alphaproteobacteria bacterium]
MKPVLSLTVQVVLILLGILSLLAFARDGLQFFVLEAHAGDTREPGAVFRDCTDCPEMVVIRAGSFTMGSPEGEEGRTNNEGPQRYVTIAKPFAVGRFEVTFAEWDACVADGGCNGYRPDDNGWGRRGARPVINVSWYDAQAYMQWISTKTGKTYRLLSEAEWEYVARASTITPFYTGETILTDQANYDGTYTYGPARRRGEYRKQTVAVGSFPPNAFGLYDMHGNVWEWCQDAWNNSYDGPGRPDDGRPWLSGNSRLRVLRGGSWGNNPQDLRSATRNYDFPTDRAISVGFRLASTL